MGKRFPSKTPRRKTRSLKRSTQLAALLSVAFAPLAPFTAPLNARTESREPASQTVPGTSFMPAVGRIVCRASGLRLMSTATLVEDRRTLLTVSHFNFDDASDHAMPVEDCEFQFLDATGRVGFRSRIEVVARGAQGKSLRISRATDWAILRLSETAPVDRYPLMVDSTSLLDDHTPVNLVAYDGKHKMMSTQFADSDCEPEPSSPRSIILEHKCETAPGASGAPLIMMVGGHPRVVAIHTARNSAAGLAVRFAGAAAQSMAERNRS